MLNPFEAVLGLLRFNFYFHTTWQIQFAQRIHSTA